MNNKKAFATQRSKSIIWGVIGLILISNLGAIIDSFLHPEIKYFDSEHMIVGGVTALVFGIMLLTILMYIERLEKRSHDISQSEKALSESEEKFRSLLDSQESNILMLDFDGVHHYVNQVGIASLTASDNAQNIIGKRLHDLYPAHIADWKLEQIRRVITTGQGMSGDFQNVVDDQTSWWHLNLQPIRNASGQVAQVMVNSHDITARKQAEAALRESELKYRSLIESSSDAIFCVDEKGQYQFTNQLFASTFGKTPDYFIEKTFWDIYPKEHADYRFEATTRVFQTGESESLEVEVPLPDKTLFFYATANPVKDETGKVILVLTHAVNITERKLAEEALHNSEEEFHSLAESMPQIVWITRPDGWNIYFNQQWVDYTGLTLEESYGDGWNKPFHPDDRQRSWDAWQNATKNGAEYSLECRLRRADGIYTWWLIRGVPLFAENGKILKWFGTCTDIHELKQAEEKLRESEERYRLLANNVPDIIYSLESAGNIVTVNSPAFERYGYTEQDSKGKPFLDFIHPEDREIVIGSFLKALEEQRKFTHGLQFRIVAENGLSYWFELNSQARFDSQGGYAGEDGVLRDITERKQAEEAQQEAELLYHALFEQAHDAIFILDLQGRHLAVNQRASEMLGYQSQEMLGLSVKELSAETLESERVLERLLKGEHIPVYERIFRKKNGQPVPVEINVELVFDIHGYPMHIQSVVRDISERKYAEDEIHQLNASLEQRVEERTHELRDAQEKLVRNEKLAVLGQMASSVGHELRNPLAVMTSAVYYLKLVQPDADEKIKKYLDMIQQEVRTSEKIITDLLDFARVKFVDREAVSVSELVRQTLERFPAPASVDVSIDIPADLPRAYVDLRQMIQVLGNLTVNACQAMKDGGKLNISAIVENNFISIAVKDSGVGISAENMKKLFEPLFTTKAKGIGLGLAVSKKLIEANGGRIEVESEAGPGSTFTVWLPVK